MRLHRSPVRLAQSGVVAAVVAVVYGAAARAHTWNSDDVALQVAMRTWAPGRKTLYLPEGTWFLRLPLYAVTELVLGSSSSTLAVQSVFLNIVSAVLVWWFVDVTLAAVGARMATPLSPTKRGWIAVLVTGWTFTLGTALIDSFQRPNLRNLEIGLVCVGIVLTVRRLPGTNALGPIAMARRMFVPSLWFGVLAVDDPTVMYGLVGPIALVAALVLGWRRAPTAWALLVGAATSLIVWRTGIVILGALEVETVSLDPRVIQAGELPTTLATTAEALTQLFGVPIFGARPGDLRLVSVIPQAGLLILGVLATATAVRRFRTVPLVAGAAAWAVGLLTAFALSSHGLSLVNLRYVAFAVVPIAALLAAGIIAAPARAGRLMLGLMAVSLAVGVTDSLRSWSTDVAPNADAARLVEILDAADVHRGYGDFWETLGPSYFDDSVTLVPVSCVEDGITAARHWFVDGSIARPDPDAPRTAYIHNGRAGLSTCSLEQVTAQFGVPLETIDVTASIQVLIFQGDIGRELGTPAAPG